MTDRCLHGVVVRSELDLGGPEAGNRRPELMLEVGPARPVGVDPPDGTIVLELMAAGRRIHTGAVQGSRAVLRIHGLCEFAVELDAGRVVCTPDPAATRGQLALLVRGSLLAFYLGLTGACVLHGSLVEVGADGAAVGFVAGSGMGKSTLAAWVCGAGGRFVADDLVRLDASTPPGWVGGSAELRLRPAATSLADAGGPAWAPRATVDGRTAVIPERARHDAGRLAAVVVPSPVRGAAVAEVRRLGPVEAVMALARFPRLEQWRSPAAVEAHFDGVSRLADSVPVYAARLPWGPPFRSDVVVDLLEAIGVPAHLARVG